MIAEVFVMLCTKFDENSVGSIAKSHQARYKLQINGYKNQHVHPVV
jgi:hypothetical protein